jgi:Tfp pilus assembly protein PilN
MTTLATPPPAQAAAPPGGTPGFVSVFADLMPEEVVASRHARVVKRYVLVGLAAVLFLLAAGYGATWFQTRSAEDDLTSTQQLATALQLKQQEFQPLVIAQRQSSQIQQTIGKLMAGDLQWTHLLDDLRASARQDISFTGLTGTVAAGGATGAGAVGAAGGLGVLNQSGQLQVGTLTITGTAPDKNSVAAFVDRLGKIPGLAAAFPASVTSTDGKASFSVSVIITSEALGGRFTPTSGATGGH